MTVALHQAPVEQERVKQVFEKISRANRDPHQLFNQIGLELGFVPKQTVQGAFITQWLRENGEQVSNLVEEIRKAVTNNSSVNAT
jgi:hypothetical protein